MGDLAVLVAALVLTGTGYAAWHWLLRRLRACEDRVAQLEAERRAWQDKGGAP